MGMEDFKDKIRVAQEVQRTASERATQAAIRAARQEELRTQRNNRVRAEQAAKQQALENYKSAQVATIHEAIETILPHLDPDKAKRKRVTEPGRIFSRSRLAWSFDESSGTQEIRVTCAQEDGPPNYRSRDYVQGLHLLDNGTVMSFTRYTEPIISEPVFLDDDGLFDRASKWVGDMGQVNLDGRHAEAWQQKLLELPLQ